MSASLSSISSLADSTGPPHLPPDSPGSSVSSRFQEEYDELLKYAVVIPAQDADTLPRLATDMRDSYTVQASTPRNDDQHDGTDEMREHGTASSLGYRALTPTSQQLDQSGEHTPRVVSFRGALSEPPEYTSTVDDHPRSHLSDSQEDEDVVSVSESDFTISLDHDVARMDNLLDQWTADLKHKVLGEFGQAKIRVIEHHRKDVIKERERHAGECSKLQAEIENLKELLHTYELSIERKDHVISNLTRGLQKQKQRFEMLRTFCDWKMSHCDAKREAFTSVLAKRHHERVLSRRCWDAWHSVVENTWKQRVEKACQAKAQEVCLNLTNDYQAQIQALNESLESARGEVARLNAERERYEETMKKAFMRGVCALNMEAMSMFNGASETSPGGSVDGDMEEQLNLPTTIPQEPVYSSEPPGAPPPRVVVANQASSRVQVTDTAITSQSKGRGKTSGRGKSISVKVTGRSGPGGSAGGTLNPPMSSVIVERHQPINKQTIGHATASKYPAVKQNTLTSANTGVAQQVGMQRKIAGQVTQSSSHNVKIVE